MSRFFRLHYADICNYKYEAWKGESQRNEELDKVKYSIKLLGGTT
jgi:hypothetical protein